jgi:hypothetical protein
VVDVTVNDGKLTIAPATGATPRICFVDITHLVLNKELIGVFQRHLINILYMQKKLLELQV